VKVVLFILSEYFELDSSKYRLAISNESLIPSLRAMQREGHDVSVVLRMSPMDPRWTARVAAFESSGLPGCMWHDYRRISFAKGPLPYLEVNLPDDLALTPDWLSRTMAVADSLPAGEQNVWINSHVGCVFDAEGIRECRSVNSAFKCRLVRTMKRMPAIGVVGAEQPIWMQPQHKMMAGMEIESYSENVLNKFCDDSIHLNTLRRYCELRVCTGTSAGAISYRHWSRSVIHAGNYRGGRLR
jgi:hypothetical protein